MLSFVLWHWPHLLAPLSWPWRNPWAYNFSSSEWGGAIFHALELGVLYAVVRPGLQRARRHLECSEAGCTAMGHPVHGTPYRACHTHHPGAVHRPGEAVTAAHMAEAHAKATGR